MTAGPTDGGPSGSEDQPENGVFSAVRRRVGRLVPRALRRNLLAKLLILLFVGAVISGAVLAVSYVTIHDDITEQVETRVESDTTVQATVYENWLTERWTALNVMARSDEMHHESRSVVHQWLVAERTGVSEDVHSLHVVDADTGEIFGSSKTRYHGIDLYERGFDETNAKSLIFISLRPIELDEDLPRMTLVGVRSGDRLLVAAVPANTSLVQSQAFDSATSSLRSLDGTALIGNTTTGKMALSEGLDEGTTVLERDDCVVGVRVIAHDVLDAEPTDQNDPETTTRTVVVTRAPKEKAFAVRNEITQHLVVGFGLTFVLLIGTAAVSMRSVTADVDRLSERARRISEGSFDVDVSSDRLDEIGTLYRAVGDMRDSLRDRIEQAERREREMERARNDAERARGELRQVIDMVPDPIFAKNRDGEYILANQAIAESYGYDDPSEVEGASSFDVVPNEADARKFHDDDVAVLDSGEPRRIAEDTLTTHDGRTRTIQTTKIPFESVDTGEDAVLGYARDVTELKERERELEEREAKYRSLFEDTHDALMLFDRDGYFDCNGTALELFGVDSVEEFVEYTPWELSPATQPDGTDSKEAALAHVDEAFEEGNAFFEFTHQRVDGTEFPAEVKLSRFEHEGDPALHSLVRDITERKEYERQLQTQRDNLDVLNKMVRHDIRNEIQIVRAYAESLERHVDDAGEEYVEQVLDSARYAADITETARDVAEVMVQADAELAPLDFRHVLVTEVEDVRSSYEAAVVKIEGEVPDLEILADDLFESVVRNLLKNAIDHNDEDVPRVAVSATRVDGDVVLRVADNGPGIPDERKEAIFEEGEQGLDSDGTGLGLYLVRTLVDRYGGEVWVEDNDPEGAVFYVELPVHS